jgi:hypothetical protein
MAHNVPAVYDVFAVAIKKTAGFQQPQKCVWSERGNGAKRNDLANGRPSRFSGAAYTDLLCEVGTFYNISYFPN